MMLNYKNYLKKLFIILFAILSTVYIYTYVCAKYYAIPLVHSISVDAKFLFIRDMKHRGDIDTIVLGSSIGLNNVQGVILEEKSTKVKHVLNLSGFGLYTMQIEQLLELSILFPNLKRVIYSAQFPDFSKPTVFEDYDVDFIKKYMVLGKNGINFKYAFHAFKNLIEVASHHLSWKKEYMSNRKFSYLNFDSTGSAPLHIYGKDIINHRWKIPHTSYPIKENYKSLERMLIKSEKKGINFYLVIQPYRAPLVEQFEGVRSALNAFDHMSREILLAHHGKLLNLHKQLHLSDENFADRSHLNDKGSNISAQAIASFIDVSEGDHKVTYLSVN